MKKLVTKIFSVLISLAAFTTCTCPVFAATSSQFTQEQTWVSITDNEKVSIPSYSVVENCYIAPTAGTQTVAAVSTGTESSPYTLIGDDNRYEVEFPDLYPSSAIVELTIALSNGVGGGTGFFVAPNVILTAGHNLVNPQSGTAQAILINRSAVSIKNCYVPEAWSKNFNSNYDYGLIVLNDSSMGTSLGSLGLSVMTDAELSDLIVTVCGYPAESDGVLMEHVRYVQTYSTYRIWYDVDTTGGQSGSPVRLMRDRSVVIAIHTNGFDDTSLLQYNSGVRITSEIIAAVKYYSGV